MECNRVRNLQWTLNTEKTAYYIVSIQVKYLFSLDGFGKDNIEEMKQYFLHLFNC